MKKLPRDGRALNTNLAILTPLSIAHPLKPSPVSAKKSKRTFEERVREGLGDFEKSEYEFLGYRDPLGDASATTYGESSNPTRTSAIANAGDDAEQKSNDRLHARGTLSTVVAVKERAHRRSRALFTAGASRSRSSGPSPEDSPLSRSAGLSVEPPANSPTTGFYDPVANPRLSAPKGSALDTFKTLSDASLALAKESESRVEGQLAPKYAIKDTRYRQADHGSDADDEQGEWQDSGSSTSNDEDTEISDKENVPPADADDSGLHKELGTMTLGTKRLRGDGSGELEEGEIEETEKRQIKKQALPGNRASVEDVAQMKEEEEQAARHPSNMADEGK